MISFVTYTAVFSLVGFVDGLHNEGVILLASPIEISFELAYFNVWSQEFSSSQ